MTVAVFQVAGPTVGAEGERVRIKWPNDIYVVARDGEKKKVGGILVNTSFGAGKVEIATTLASAGGRPTTTVHG